MEVTVRFVYNKRTGEVEEFTIEQESGQPTEEHERSHDRIAAEIGGVLERNPRVDEIRPGQVAPSRATERRPQPPEQETEAGETQERKDRDA